MRRLLLMVCTATIASMLTAACGNGGKIYSHYVDIPASSWDRTDTVNFELPKLESAGTYMPVVMIRTNDNYKYQNLNISVSIYAGKRVKTDTLTFVIFDSNGNNKGDGLIHTEFSKKLPPIRLDTLEYTVRILNLMSETPLEGVSGIGFAL